MNLKNLTINLIIKITEILCKQKVNYLRTYINSWQIVNYYKITIILKINCHIKTCKIIYHIINKNQRSNLKLKNLIKFYY